MKGLKSVLVLAALFQISIQKSTPEDDSYVAAVVEFEVTGDPAANLQNYVQLIKEASESNADIVVFPEMTLTRGTSLTVPINGLLREHPVPALEPLLYDEVLVTLSAAANSSQIYVVVNVQEIMNCTTPASAQGDECPEQIEYYFNTNVVFDRNGAVIDRYRKINLFFEASRSPALQPDLGVFDTDFGVKFGHFICFDLMFQVPAVQIVQKYNLTDIIFPTMWFSEMPYLSATQIQEAYAYTLNVNFLASGANNVGVGSAGSGIYSGKAGALASIMPGAPTTKLLVQRVPKVPGQVTTTYPGHISDDPTTLDNLHLISDPSLPSHTSRLLTAGYNDFVLTDKDVSCHFRVKMTERNADEAPFYRAFVQDEPNAYSHRKVHHAICSIISCKSENITECAYRFKNKKETNFIQELEIDMTSYGPQYNNTLQCEDILYYPISFTNGKFPLKPEEFSFTIKQNEISKDTNNGRMNIIYTLNSPQKDLFSFAVYGRVYNKDVNSYNSRIFTEEDLNAYNVLEAKIYDSNEIEISLKAD